MCAGTPGTPGAELNGTANTPFHPNVQVGPSYTAFVLLFHCMWAAYMEGAGFGCDCCSLHVGMLPLPPQHPRLQLQPAWVWVRCSARLPASCKKQCGGLQAAVDRLPSRRCTVHAARHSRLRANKWLSSSQSTAHWQAFKAAALDIVREYFDSGAPQLCCFGLPLSWHALPVGPPRVHLALRAALWPCCGPAVALLWSTLTFAVAAC